jgi:hypothetical protein
MFFQNERWLVASLHPGSPQEVQERGAALKEHILENMKPLNNYTKNEPKLEFCHLELDKINATGNIMGDKKLIYAHLLKSLFDPISHTYSSKKCKNIAVILERKKLKKLFSEIIQQEYFGKPKHLAVCYGENEGETQVDFFATNGKVLLCESETCYHCKEKNLAWNSCSHTCFWRLILRLYNDNENVKKYLYEITNTEMTGIDVVQ